MNLSATIAKMRAAGMTSEAILLALECLVIEQTPERSGAARRQAAYRVRVRERNALRNGDVTGDDVVSPLVPPFPPAPPIPPIIPPSTKNTRATALPDDWQPNAKTWALADELGFTSQEAWDQLERMRDWARNAGGGKGKKSDWNAAFRNWIKRAADERKSKPQAPRRNNLHDTLAVLDAVTDEAIRRAGGYGPEGSEENPDLLPGLRKSAA